MSSLLQTQIQRSIHPKSIIRIYQFKVRVQRSIETKTNFIGYSNNTIKKLSKKISKFTYHNILPTQKNIIKIISLTQMNINNTKDVDNKEEPLANIKNNSLEFIKLSILSNNSKLVIKLTQSFIAYSAQLKHLEIVEKQFYELYFQLISIDSKDSDNFQLLLYFINLSQQLNLSLLEDKFYQHFYWCYLTKKQHFLYKFILLNLKWKSELATELTLKTLAMGSLREEKYSLQYKDLIQTVFSYLSKNDSKQLIEMGNRMKDNYQLYQKSLNMLGKEVQMLYKGMLIYELKKKLELSVFSKFIQQIDIYQWPNVMDSCINRSLLIYFRLLKEKNNENENTTNHNRLTIETITSFYNNIKQYKFINIINTLLYGLILNDEFLLAHQFLINFNIQLNQQLLQTMLYGNKLNLQYLQIFNYYQQQIKIQNIQLNNPILSLLLQNLIYHQQYEVAYNYLLQYNSEADIKLKSIISKLFIYLNYQQIQILKNKFNLFNLQNEYQLSSLLSLAINKKQYNLLNYLIKEHLINSNIKIDSNLANKLKIIQLKFPSLKNQLHLLKQ